MQTSLSFVTRESLSEKSRKNPMSFFMFRNSPFFSNGTSCFDTVHRGDYWDLLIVFKWHGWQKKMDKTLAYHFFTISLALNLILLPSTTNGLQGEEESSPRESWDDVIFDQWNQSTQGSHELFIYIEMRQIRGYFLACFLIRKKLS